MPRTIDMRPQTGQSRAWVKATQQRATPAARPPQLQGQHAAMKAVQMAPHPVRQAIGIVALIAVVLVILAAVFGGHHHHHEHDNDD